MNALVGVRANGTGLYTPSSAERRKVRQQVLSAARVHLFGAAKSLSPPSRGIRKAKAGNDTSSDGSAIAGLTGQDLDRDAFLQLMVQQMQYQDPLDPISNEDMLAQLAQFSSLEQMKNLNDSFEKLSQQMVQQNMVTAGALLGRTISGNDLTGNPVQGTVERVSLVDGEIRLQVGEQLVPIQSVQSIGIDSDG